MEKICILGLGYVGLTLSVHAVKNGYEVHGVEILEHTRNSIKCGKAPFYEPGIDELIKTYLDKQLFVHEEVPNDIEFSVFIISVGTPLIGDGVTAPNMKILEKCISDVAQSISDETLVILRSTVPVGTTRQVESEILVKSGMKSINIAFCPERTAEGNALVELKELPQVISGTSKLSLEKSKDFFHPLVDELVVATSVEEAEITKLFNNVYRDSVFALANTFSYIAQHFGIDGAKAIKNANYNYPRSAIPIPGFVAGPCLEKDAYILTSNLDDGPLKGNILTSRKMNEQLESDLKNWIETLIVSHELSSILISGLAFKGRPETNDLRGSSSIKILKQLKAYENIIICHDFMNSREDLEKIIDFQCLDPDFYRDYHDSDFDLIIILNNHQLYSSKAFNSFILQQIQRGAKLFDAWDVLDPKEKLTLSNYKVRL